MAYRAPDGQTFRLGRSWRSYLDVGVATCGALSVVFAPSLPTLLVPLTLVTTGYGLARVYSGVPRMLELHGSEVRLRWWARRSVTLALGTTRVQLLPDEIVLISPEATYALDRDDFRHDEFETCATLFERAAPQCVRKNPLRARRGPR